MQNEEWALEKGYGRYCGLKISNQSLVSKGVVSSATSIFKLEYERQELGPDWSTESPMRIQSALTQNLSLINSLS